MSNEIYRMIGEITIFMICGRVITHFRPKGSYEKYLKMLLSIMLLIQFFQPVCSIFLGGSDKSLEQSVAGFQESMNASMEEAAGRAAIAEQKLEQMSLLEVQERLKEQRSDMEGEEESSEYIEENDGESINVLEQIGNSEEKKEVQGESNVRQVEKVQVEIEIGGN